MRDADGRMDGKPMSFWLYPPHPLRLGRKRTYAHTHGLTKEGMHIVREDGHNIYIRNDDNFYNRIKKCVTQEKMTLFVDKLGSATFVDVFMEAFRDGQKIIYSPATGLRGIRFRSGNNHGAILSTRTWSAELSGQGLLAGIRDLMDRVGCGDYDTPGSLGEATLTRFWFDNNLKREFRLSKSLTDLLNHYRIGGRAEQLGKANIIYPHAWELDLKSAYPTAVARGIPAGPIRYHTRESSNMDNEALFAEWRIIVHDLVELSPVPIIDWDNRNLDRFHWYLPPGEYYYAGWREEIYALLSTGKVSIDFLRGWSWSQLSSMLTPWVEQLYELRTRAEEAGEMSAAFMVKLAMNSAIGRWGMLPERWDIVPEAEHDLRWDLPIMLQPWEVDQAIDQWTGLWYRHVEEEAKHATPHHWESYVRMAVRMELWRFMSEIRRHGGEILDTNYDAIRVMSIPQGTDNYDVIAAQERHPWRWKRTEVKDVELPYIRGAIFEMNGTLKSILPGLSGAMRQAKLVDHMRKRKKRNEESA